MSLDMLIHVGCFPISAFMIGAVTERWSQSTAFFVWGAGGLTTLAVLMGARRRRGRSAACSVMSRDVRPV